MSIRMWRLRPLIFLPASKPFDPLSIGGPDGLDAIRRIVAQSQVHLNPRGWLIFEHGFDQAGACAALLENAGYCVLFMSLDLAGLPRVSGARLRSR